MTYVIVDKDTQCKVMYHGTRTDKWATERAAKGVLTRMVKTTGYLRSELTVMSIEDYVAQVPMVERVNMMTGVTYMERADTPSYCSPASEAYWSM
jgi:hypothetical protein